MTTWSCWCNAVHDQAGDRGAAREVSAVVHHSAGVECEVVLVPPKSLPFTSSGKLSRAGAKQRYLSASCRDRPGGGTGLPRSRA